MAAHRHWRVNVTLNNGDSGGLTSIGRLEMYESAFGANVCTGGTASANGFITGFEPEDAFTWAAGYKRGWAVSQATGWLAYDFGAGNEKDIVAISIAARPSGVDIQQLPRDFKLEFSDNGIDWTPFFTVASQTLWIPGQSRRFIHPSFAPTLTANSEHGSHDFWRLLVQRAANSDFIGAAEVEMRATSGGGDQCTGGTASASSEFDASFVAGNAFDDNSSTAWNTTGVETGWLRYAFAAAVEVYEVLIQCRPSSTTEAPKDLLIQWSDDGSVWTTAWSINGQTGWSTGESRVFTDPETFTLGSASPVPPSKPTLTVDAIAEQDADLSMSAFLAGQGGTHDVSQWRAYLQGGDPVADLVYDSGESNDLLSHNTGPNLPNGTALSFQGRQKETPSGLFSAWSDPVDATTAAGTPPTKPVLSVDAIRENDADLSIAGFTAGEGGTHAKTQWRAYLSGGDPLADLVYDSGASNDLLAHTTDPALPPGTALDFEARVQETPSGLFSPWSDPVTDTTSASTAEPDTPSVLTATGVTGLSATSSVYSHPGAVAHAASRWQTVVDGGDPDTPADVVHDSGPDATALEAYDSPDGVLEENTAYDQYVTHIDANGGEARSGPFDFTTSSITLIGGALLEFLDAGGSLVEAHEVTTASTAYVALVLENIPRPAGAPFARLKGIKRGTAVKGASVRKASIDKGRMAIGFKTRPYMPEADDFFDHGLVSANSTIDWSRGRFQTIELDANLVAVHLNARVGQELELLLTQDGTGGRTIDLGATGEPTYSTGAGDVDYVRIRKTGTSTYIVVAEKLGIS